MTAQNRREKLETMLARDPRDAFLRYALALEWAKEGDYERSLAGLRDLTGDDPPHVPAFFMAAQQLARLDRIAEARAMLRDGIDEARRQGNSHAAGEMSEFLASLGSRGE
jgi:tetratricopeptide (TPR) repeat protein